MRSASVGMRMRTRTREAGRELCVYESGKESRLGIDLVVQNAGICSVPLRRAPIP